MSFDARSPLPVEYCIEVGGFFQNAKVGAWGRSTCKCSVNCHRKIGESLILVLQSDEILVSVGILCLKMDSGLESSCNGIRSNVAEEPVQIMSSFCWFYNLTLVALNMVS